MHNFTRDFNIKENGGKIMNTFLTKENIKSTFLTKEMLLRCTYESREQGFKIDSVKLDDLLEDANLSSESYLKTECGILLWVMNAGWVLVPELGGNMNWMKFEKLGDFLERNGIVLKAKEVLQDSLLVYKERLAKDYLDVLEVRLESVKLIIKDESKCDPDDILLAVKDFRTTNTKTLKDIQIALEIEITAFKQYIKECQSNKEWDFKSLIVGHLQNSRDFVNSEERVPYTISG